MEEPLAGPQGPSLLCESSFTDLTCQDPGDHAALWQAEMLLERCAGPNPGMRLEPYLEIGPLPM